MATQTILMHGGEGIAHLPIRAQDCNQILQEPADTLILHVSYFKPSFQGGGGRRFKI